jgi:hypothetical protein
MSGRGASVAVLHELNASANKPFHLFELYLDSDIICATDAFKTIVWQGRTYYADGSFLQFDQVEETGDLSGNQTMVTLSGVDQIYIAEILRNNFVDRRLVIRKAFFNGANAVIIDPIPILDGRIDQPTIIENPDDGTCTVALTAGSHWIDFERRAGRHTSDAEQKLWFAGDTGFRLVGANRANVKWGAA